MAETRIAGALLVVALTSCSVREPVQPPQVLQATTAARNAGLRSDFKAPC